MAAKPAAAAIGSIQAGTPQTAWYKINQQQQSWDNLSQPDTASPLQLHAQHEPGRPKR